jgi:hypothetical protein
MANHCSDTSARILDEALLCSYHMWHQVMNRFTHIAELMNVIPWAAANTLTTLAVTCIRLGHFVFLWCSTRTITFSDKFLEVTAVRRMI